MRFKETAAASSYPYAKRIFTGSQRLLIKHNFFLPGARKCPIFVLNTINMKKIYFSLLILIFLGAGTRAQTPTLLKDIIPGSTGGFTIAGQFAYTSYPFNVVWQNAGKIYFVANTSSTWSSSSYTNEFELWMSDGTTNGTVLLKDICPGSVGSGPTDFHDVNGTLYFTADDGVNGRELWKTDGTPGGTVMVKDIIAGASSGFSTTGQWGPSYYPFNIVWQNGPNFYFRAVDYLSSGGDNIELWKSDGTTAGTVRVKDINGTNLSSSPEDFNAINGTLYFTANDGISGRELWKTDGTSAGTVLVKDIIAGASGGFTTTGQWGPTYYPFTVVWQNGSNFYFRAVDFLSSGSDNIELWKSDGTAAGTVMVKDICPGNTSSQPIDFKAINGTLYFTANDGTSGRELWKTDGTSAGTVLVKDIIAGNPGGFTTTGQWGPSAYTFSVVWQNGSNFYFNAVDNLSSSGDNVELWKSDGTSGGTVRVKDINPGTTGSFPIDFADVNGTLYFTADDGASGRELWKTDGTSGGTVMVKDIVPGNIGGFSVTGQWGLQAYNFSVAWVSGSTFYFTADNNPSSSGDDVELWKSDGTSAGTMMLKDINPGQPGSWPQDFKNINGTIFFVADNGTAGRELWKSDGTVAGTQFVKDILPGNQGGFTLAAQYAYNTYNFYPAFMVNNEFFFPANDYATVPNGGAYDNNPELWKSDGTTGGTSKVLEIYPSATIGSYPAEFATALGKVFFTAQDPVNGRELWVVSNAVAIGVNETSAGGEWVLFPNPANEKVNIVYAAEEAKSAEVKLEVYDVNGRRIYQDIILGGVSTPGLSVDISSFAPGIYLFLLNDGARVTTKKIIKQ